MDGFGAGHLSFFSGVMPLLNTEDILAPGVLLGKGVQLWQNSAQKRGKSWQRVYIWKPVLQHFHTCLLEGGENMTVSRGRKAFGEVHVIGLLWEKSCLKVLLASGMNCLLSVVLWLADLCIAFPSTAFPQKSPQALEAKLLRHTLRSVPITPQFPGLLS